MDRNRIWALGATLLIVAVVALGALLGISPKMEEASQADAARVSVEAQNAAQALQLDRLKTQYLKIGELKTQLSDLRRSIPAGPAIPALVAQLDAVAQRGNVTITSVSVGDAALYAPAPAAAGVAAVAVPATGKTPATGETVVAAGAGSASPGPAPASAAPEVASSVTSVATFDTTAAGAKIANGRVTAQNFVSVPITLSVAGTFAHMLDYLESLQKGERLFLVTTFTTAAEAGSAGGAAGGSGGISATLSGFVYVLLDTGATGTSG